MKQSGLTLKGSIFLSFFLGIFFSSALTAWILHLLNTPTLAVVLGVLFGMLVSIVLVSFSLKSLSRFLGAFQLGILNLKDSDYNVQLPEETILELKEIVSLFNELTETMRLERKNIYQRELLLNTILQQSPSATILVNERNQIIFSNKAARIQFWDGKKMEGHTINEISNYLPDPFKEAFGSDERSLLSIKGEKRTETYQVFKKKFLINMKTNHLLMFHRLTRELEQKEAIIWKQAIRLMNHEINNSLAPISSMIHSAKLISNQKDGAKKLGRVFNSLENNIQNLTRFLESYGKFARLPQPRKEIQDWDHFLNQLNEIIPFHFGEVVGKGWFDPIQMQQVLVNILKNAKESGSSSDEIQLNIQKIDEEKSLISIVDRGEGMDHETMARALLPFFSTKEKGSGLGLPLCREIIEMHGGSLMLKARMDGGLLVQIIIPNVPCT